MTLGGPAIPPPIRAAGAAPIIVTATMGAADQRFFDTLRAAHFPPERNYLAAHITLFHQLPPSALDELDGLIRRIAADTPPPAARLRELYSLGKGVAYRIDSPDLLAIRERIAEHFTGMLTAQDQGTPRLHITVQNKVDAQRRTRAARRARRRLPAAPADHHRPRRAPLSWRPVGSRLCTEFSWAAHMILTRANTLPIGAARPSRRPCGAE